ncbi:MAG: DUF4825 domain-containing protein [Roseburia sp.]|nr:DUF4825 domain-containing protein [Roseburia sp.]
MREIFWGLYGIWNTIQNMVWQISIVIGIVLVCRLFVGKVSKQASYLLWIVVAIRLLCPVMIPSDFSIFNWLDVSKMIESQDVVFENDAMEEATSDVVQVQTTPQTVTTPEVQEDVGTNAVLIENGTSAEVHNKVTHNYFLDRLRYLMNENPDFFLWMTGMTLMAVYGIGSYVHLKYKLRFATKSGESIFESNEVSSPFVFGIIKPKIYLPYHMNEQEKRYILAHERYHIKRRDYLVKIFAFALLTVYWFHPLVWVAFYLMSRDMEISCDEQVLKNLAIEDRKAYSTLLLSFASGKHFPLPSPLSFGENDTKSRIKSILNYKKPTFWSLVAVLALTVVLVMSCLTDASNSEENETDNTTIDETYEITDEATQKLAEKLLAIKSPYIGDAVTSGYIFNELLTELGVAGQNGIELQTTSAPYWITFSFDAEPSAYKMWQAAAMYLALVENANEVRWNYYNEYYTLCTQYVTVDSVNAYLGDINIKDYAGSVEKIAELWTLLDQKRTQAIYETNGESASILVSSTSWDRNAIEAGMEFEERIAWENRLIADGIGYRGDNGLVADCIYQDFDQNGIKDFIAIIRDTNWDDDVDERFYIYMNNESAYIHELQVSGAFWGVTVADIDNDNCLEFLFAGDSGGTGGYGFNAIYELLKYKNGTFEVMPLPIDDFVEYKEETAGFGIEVYTVEGEGNYVAYCPALEESVTFSIGSSRSEAFEADTPVNTLVGRERYGFHGLTPVLQNGKMYLLAVESIYRTNIDWYMEDIGTAYFLLSWDEQEGWITEKFDVIAYGSEGITDDEIFERMLHELTFYPTTYEDVMATGTMPVVDINNQLIKDSTNSLLNLRNFASMESGEENGYVGNKMIYVKLTEDKSPVYHYIYHNSDGRYFYLEASAMSSGNPGTDYSAMKTGIYADCISETFERDDDTTHTYYYLVEKGISVEDIYKYLLSSTYTKPKFVSFLSVSTSNAFETVEEYIISNWDTMPYRGILSAWQTASVENVYWNGHYDEDAKSYVFKNGEETYVYDLADVLNSSDDWNWVTAGIFFDDDNEKTYLCLTDFNYVDGKEVHRNLQTLLIEFPKDNPNDYKVTAFEEGLAWIDRCYFIKDTIYIRGESLLLALNVDTKELRSCKEERTLLEAYAQEEFGGYHIFFFDAIRKQNDMIVYSAVVSEAEDVTPVGMVFVTYKDGKPIGYMSADYSAENATDGITIKMTN